MSLVRRLAFLASLSLFIGSCAQIDPSPAKEETSFFLARYNKVWTTTLKVLEAQSISVQSSDKEKGIITTKFIVYSTGEKAHHALEEIAYRPDIPLGFYTHVHYRLFIQMLTVNEMSMQVKVSAKIEAYDKNITRKWHTCETKNVVEQTMLDRIRAAL